MKSPKTGKRFVGCSNYKEKIWGEIEENKVSVTCVPKANELVKEYFTNLPELEYK